MHVMVSTQLLRFREQVVAHNQGKQVDAKHANRGLGVGHLGDVSMFGGVVHLYSWESEIFPASEAAPARAVSGGQPLPGLASFPFLIYWCSPLERYKCTSAFLVLQVFYQKKTKISLV